MDVVHLASMLRHIWPLVGLLHSLHIQRADTGMHFEVRPVCQEVSGRPNAHVMSFLPRGLSYKISLFGRPQLRSSGKTYFIGQPPEFILKLDSFHGCCGGDCGGKEGRGGWGEIFSLVVSRRVLHFRFLSIYHTSRHRWQFSICCRSLIFRLILYYTLCVLIVLACCYIVYLFPGQITPIYSCLPSNSFPTRQVIYRPLFCRVHLSYFLLYLLFLLPSL